eukprot:scaffold64912_cov28-Phaeocystis_antarctica.AAC.2
MTPLMAAWEQVRGRVRVRVRGRLTLPLTNHNLTPNPLLAAWEQIDDPTSGPYYYNSSTGETTYDRPAMPADKNVKGAEPP